jgi:hypothetical protein
MLFACLLMLAAQAHATTIVATSLNGDKDGFGIGSIAPPNIFQDNSDASDPPCFDSEVPGPGDDECSWVFDFTSDLSGYDLTGATFNSLEIVVRETFSDHPPSDLPVIISFDGNDFDFTATGVSAPGAQPAFPIDQTWLFSGDFVEDLLADLMIDVVFDAYPEHLYGGAVWDDIMFDYSEATLSFTLCDSSVTNCSSTAVPEPASVLLFGSGLLGLGYVRRRKARRA